MLLRAFSLCLSTLIISGDGTDRHQHGALHKGVRSLPEESTYLLPRDNRDMGIVYSGSHERLRAMLGRLISGMQRAHICTAAVRSGPLWHPRPC